LVLLFSSRKVLARVPQFLHLEVATLAYHAGLHADGFRSPAMPACWLWATGFPGMFVGKILLAALITVISLAIFRLL
jgi:hypothetical protein